MIRAAALALALSAAPAAALELWPVDYACDGGRTVSTTYVNDGQTWAMLLLMDNRMVPLWQEMSASGVRYGDPSGQASWVWWTKGQEATLYWKDAGGQESIVLQTCIEQGTGE